MKCECGETLVVCSAYYYGDTGTRHTAYCVECHQCMMRTGYYSDIKEAQDEYLKNGFETVLTEDELREVGDNP